MDDSERPFKLRKCDARKYDEQHRDWSSLPLDILGDISSRLMVIDSYSFANVCTSWKSAATPMSPPTAFLFLRRNYFIPKPSCKLLSITDNRADKVDMPILAGKVCVGSQFGWLILVDNTVHVMSLYNPFSRKLIKLPSHTCIVPWLSGRGAALLSESEFVTLFSFKRVVLSRSPTSSSGRFLSVAALTYGGTLIYKQQGDYGWKLFAVTYYFRDIVFCRGKLIGVTFEGQVLKLDLDRPDQKVFKMGYGSFDRSCNKYYKHLINLDDDILQIWWYLDDEQKNLSVKVLKLGLHRLAPIPAAHLWVPVEDLSGHSFFLSYQHSFALSSQHIPGLKDNLIYFIPEDFGIFADNKDRDVGVFNLKSGSYEIWALPKTPISISTWAFWYTPPLHELQRQRPSFQGDALGSQ